MSAWPADTTHGTDTVASAAAPVEALSLRGSGRRQPGPDHPHHGHRPLPARPAVRWPDGTSLRVCLVLAIDNHEDEVPARWPQPQWAGGGVGMRPDPNLARIGARAYGARRGFWRLAEGFKSLELPLTVALDVLTAQTHPGLVDACLQGRFGRVHWVAHGMSWNRPIHEGMDTASELSYLWSTRQALAGCGIHTSVWYGIEYGQSARTPSLLPQAGYRICLDWCNDEQPYPFAPGASSGRAQTGLWSLPQMADLDDAFSMCSPRGVSVQAYARRLVDAAAALAVEGRQQARVMVFTLRPFLSGQPFRVDAILEALERIRGLPGVRFQAPEDLIRDWQLAEAVTPVLPPEVCRSASSATGSREP